MLITNEKVNHFINVTLSSFLHHEIKLQIYWVNLAFMDQLNMDDLKDAFYLYLILMFENRLINLQKDLNVVSIFKRIYFKPWN